MRRVKEEGEQKESKNGLLRAVTVTAQKLHPTDALAPLKFTFDDTRTLWTSAAAPSINTPVLTALIQKRCAEGEEAWSSSLSKNDVRLRLGRPR
jgi:hypothetical protein